MAPGVFVGERGYLCRQALGGSKLVVYDLGQGGGQVIEGDCPWGGRGMGKGRHWPQVTARGALCGGQAGQPVALGGNGLQHHLEGCWVGLRCGHKLKGIQGVPLAGQGLHVVVQGRQV